MLHLSVTPGAAACVDHGTMVTHHAGTPPTSGIQRATGHGTHTGDGVAEQTPAAPCDAPAQPSCCSVLTGCAPIAFSGLHNVDLLFNFTTSYSTNCGTTWAEANLFARALSY